MYMGGVLTRILLSRVNPPKTSSRHQRRRLQGGDTKSVFCVEVSPYSTAEEHLGSTRTGLTRLGEIVGRTPFWLTTNLEFESHGGWS